MKFKTYKIGLVIFTVLLILNSGSSASASQYVYADADTFVSSHYSTSAYGTGAELSTIRENYYGTIYYADAYVRFNLSGVPDSADITSAKLILSTHSVFPSHNVGVYHVGNDVWNEGTLTWNTRPPVDPNQTGVLAVTGAGVYEMSFDLFQYSQNKWNYESDLSDNMASFVLKYYSGGYGDFINVHYDSKEGSGGLLSGPRLQLEYSTPVPLPGAMLLLGSGIAGLAGYRRTFRKR